MTPSKWDGLLDEARTDTAHQAAPAPRRGPTIIALTLLAVIVAGAAVLVWRQWTTAPIPEPAASPSSTPAMDPTTSLIPAPATSAPITPETPSASPDVFAPAYSTAEAWMRAFMDNRSPHTPWASIEEAIAPYTAKPLAVYLVNTPDAQTAGVTPGTRLVSVDFSQIEADPAHPSTWSATVSYTRSDTTTGTGRITLEPAQGGWRVTRWSAQ